MNIFLTGVPAVSNQLHIKTAPPMLFCLTFGVQITRNLLTVAGIYFFLFHILFNTILMRFPDMREHFKEFWGF